MMSNRMWFEMFRFYFLVALRGDPIERKPKPKPVQRARPAPIARLRPLTDAK